MRIDRFPILSRVTGYAIPLCQGKLVSFGSVVVIVVMAAGAQFTDAIGDTRIPTRHHRPDVPATLEIARGLRISTDPNSFTSPSAAPTEERLEVERLGDRYKIGDAVIAFNADHRLTPLRGYDPALSGDGRLIVYFSRNDRGPSRHGADLMLSSDGGRSSTALLSSESAKFQPLFSADDQYVAFLTSEQVPELRTSDRGTLWVQPVDGGEPFRVSELGGSVVFNLNDITNFDWSPVRNELAYIQREVVGGRTTFALYIRDVQEPRSRLVRRFEPDRTFGRSWQEGRLLRPQWSPDGRRLGVLFGSGGRYVFFQLDRDNGSPTRIAGINISSAFDWLTNDTIVYGTGGAGTYRLAKFTPGEISPTFLTREGSSFLELVWPTSRLISFTTRGFVYIEPQGDLWAHDFKVFRPSSDKPQTVIQVTDYETYGPIAQRFDPDMTPDQGITVPSRLMFDAMGNRGVIAVEGRIFVATFNRR